MRLLRSPFVRACLLGALFAAPLGALVQRSMTWQILHVDTATVWGIDLAIYAVCILVLAGLAGALALPIRWLVRRVVSGLSPALASLLAVLLPAGLGLWLFAQMTSWSLRADEQAKLLLVLVTFYGIFHVVLNRAATVRESAPVGST